MKATDSDFVFSIKTIICAILNSSSVEQTFALHCEIKPRFLDLIRSPHGHRILCIHGKLDRFCERKVSTGRYGTVISLWNNAAARAVKDAQMGIAQEIVRQPADGKRFKFPIPISSKFETRRQLGLLIIRKDSNDRDKRVRKFRVIPAVLVSKRNDEISLARVTALTQAGRDFGFDTIYDLRVEGHIIVRKINICLRDDGQSKKYDEGSEKHIDRLPGNDSDWKSRVGWGLARQVGHPARLNLPAQALYLQGRSHPATPSEAQPLDRHSVRDTSAESGSAAPLENSPWRRAYKAVP